MLLFCLEDFSLLGRFRYYLFVKGQVYKVLIYQETAKGPFRSSIQAATCFKQSRPLKVRGNPVKCLAQGHNKRPWWTISTLSLFNAERLAGSGVTDGGGIGKNALPGSSGVGPFLETGLLNSACFAT